MTDHLTSPNFGGLSEFATDPTKVDKPWGYELIWALTDDYCGKILFVKAGESLSLQFHRVKDEAWLSTRAARRSRWAIPATRPRTSRS